ncbi:hypothetical protein ACU686_16020 [Yinghuangia aomiensis]
MHNVAEEQIDVRKAGSGDRVGATVNLNASLPKEGRHADPRRDGCRSGAAGLHAPLVDFIDAIDAVLSDETAGPRARRGA